MASPSMPRQDIPESKKDQKWCADNLAFAFSLLQNKSALYTKKINRMYDVYNGIVNKNSVTYLTNIYGKKNRTQFTDFRAAKTKIDIIHGEFLGRPLSASVYTTNVEAKSMKMEKYEYLLGASHAKPELNDLQQKAGVNVLQGMEVPDPNDDDAWDKISLKSKNEIIMQTIINDCMHTCDLKTKFASGFLDVELVSGCFGKIIIKPNGDVDFRVIDMRDAIFVELDRDPFIQRSPVNGELRRMTVQEILGEFELTVDQRNKLVGMDQNAGKFLGTSFGGRTPYTMNGGNFTIEVVQAEWKSSRPWHTKIVANKKDPNDIPFEKDIDPEVYEKNMDKMNADVAAGKYEIKTQFQEDLWEGVWIGHEIFVNCRRKQFQMHDTDNPSLLIGNSYCGLLFGTIDGTRVSLMEVMENLSTMYNVVMYQINRELSKIKGSIIVMDEGALPRKTTMADAMYKAINDGFLGYNSSASGNISAKNMDAQKLIDKIDLGVSSTLPFLIGLKQDISATLAQITGINENREGMIKASSTATNTQQAIEASRAITEPMFYMMERYIEIVLMKMANTCKLTWAFYKSKRGEAILGSDKFKFLNVTEALADDMYGAYISDGSKEIKLRSFISAHADASINSKDLRLIDLVQAEMAETMGDYVSIIKKGWDDVAKLKQQSEQQAQQSQAEQAQKDREASIQLAREDREDRQAAKLDEIRTSLGIDITKQNNQAQNQIAVNQANQ